MATKPLAPSSMAIRTGEQTESDAADRRLPPGSLFRSPERYQIMGEHGRGGLGRVSRAHDRELGRDVAIKELISRGYVDEVRFMREAMITARLEHPGIVPVHEAGRWPDGTPFYAMKLVSGRRRDHRHRLGLRQDLTVAEEAATGGALHASDDGLTDAGSVLGTPAYMAPEQKRGEPVDQRA